MVALSLLCWSIYLCFCYIDRFRTLMQFPPSILKLSTQHPPYFFKLSTQHQPAITRIENWAILSTQGLQFDYTLIRAFPKISAYTKTVQFYSTKNTSMNKFLAQSSSPCLMLSGIPPASLSEGWMCEADVYSWFPATFLQIGNTRWRRQMEAFSALLFFCAGNSPVPGEFLVQRPVTRSFDVFFDLGLNKRFRKHSWGWWFETLMHSLWRHCNECLPKRAAVDTSMESGS